MTNVLIYVNPEFYNGRTCLNLSNVNFEFNNGDLVVYETKWLFFKKVVIILSKDSWYNVFEESYVRTLL